MLGSWALEETLEKRIFNFKRIWLQRFHRWCLTSQPRSLRTADIFLPEMSVVFVCLSGAKYTKLMQ